MGNPDIWTHSNSLQLADILNKEGNEKLIHQLGF